MDIFRQIGTELLPLTRVENWFPCSILCIFWPIVSQLCIHIDIWEEWFEIVDV